MRRWRSCRWLTFVFCCCSLTLLFESKWTSHPKNVAINLNNAGLFHSSWLRKKKNNWKKRRSLGKYSPTHGHLNNHIQILKNVNTSPVPFPSSCFVYINKKIIRFRETFKTRSKRNVSVWPVSWRVRWKPPASTTRSSQPYLGAQWMKRRQQRCVQDAFCCCV